MEWWSAKALVVMAAPLLGAVIGTIFWSKPQLFKSWVLLVTITTWLIVTNAFWTSAEPLTISHILMHLILAAGFLTILGHHPNKTTPHFLCLMLLFTGLGLGYVASKGHSGSIILCGIFGLLILALVRHRRQGGETPWNAIVMLVFGTLSLLISLVASDFIRILTLLVPLTIVWPLLPVHGVFVASVSRLPGTLPAFLAVLLPSLGFYGITDLFPVIPESVLNLLWLVAIGSVLYGSLLALTQDSMDKLLAYAHMALGAILWWYVAVTQSVAPGAVVYLCGLSLVICGLLLAVHYVQVRFVHIDLNHAHGLAHFMPRFSILFVLFITVALGFPIVALISVINNVSISPSIVGSIVVVLLAWMMSSWYLPRLMQQVLFGPPNLQLQSVHDLSVYELFSLLLLLSLLLMLGIAPLHLFGGADAVLAMT